MHLTLKNLLVKVNVLLQAVTPFISNSQRGLKSIHFNKKKRHCMIVLVQYQNHFFQIIFEVCRFLTWSEKEFNSPLVFIVHLENRSPKRKKEAGEFNRRKVMVRIITQDAFISLRLGKSTWKANRLLWCSNINLGHKYWITDKYNWNSLFPCYFKCLYIWIHLLNQNKICLKMIGKIN